MSLTRRKARPLKRDGTRLRDDRLFIVACDDTYAPKQYFDFSRFPGCRCTSFRLKVAPLLPAMCWNGFFGTTMRRTTNSGCS